MKIYTKITLIWLVVALTLGFLLGYSIGFTKASSKCAEAIISTLDSMDIETFNINFNETKFAEGLTPVLEKALEQEPVGCKR